ncbi:SDR family NAD(P)-dependent oxidoreductase [Sulfitobacter guttiformis]|uniref:3-oxoacyl-(Acyl-carrier-protein) reductase FabG n=1 Tax=Sulfitobacter guttiformis TaxID=74349 RepID=J7FW42_9RHOB|nr:SDR family oxidoreductase [Sulfitobacter guttiformis]AFP55388.1 3-oxoacyl-(acyl-carrier-protein) reductase FabG [Sulfitobacter guttiformis]KIN75542.1 3-oxoacyl-(Acyl-carrier-protein) reductase FabG [Sulfitobacter guttiformis KCTC 32187]RKE91053.1 3-oxoacyl-[acyl-carrier protein] reductase/2-hydroxycyclohexanecarboxyl-CoA dehydrogenase [Sulfitobacter guttiformis]
MTDYTRETGVNKIAVVTGAAGGMGRAIVARLIADDMTVIGLDVDAAGLEEMGADPAFKGIVTDLTSSAAIASAFAQIAAAHGGVDALVNNAGTCFMSEFPDIPEDEFERQMALNFTGAFHCCQAAIKLMEGRDGVRKIVNISSNGAYNFDAFDPPHYRASKAALDTLTKDLARRYATRKIAVNSIAPAMTETPLFGVVSAEVLANAIAQMPHGRAMQPSEIAAWVGFLISPAGDISSGNVIILNQGRDVR